MGSGADPAVFRPSGAGAGTGTVPADSTANTGTVPTGGRVLMAAGQAVPDARGPLPTTGTDLWWPLGAGLVLLLLGGALRWRTR